MCALVLALLLRVAARYLIVSAMAVERTEEGYLPVDLVLWARTTEAYLRTRLRIEIGTDKWEKLTYDATLTAGRAG